MSNYKFETLQLHVGQEQPDVNARTYAQLLKALRGAVQHRTPVFLHVGLDGRDALGQRMKAPRLALVRPAEHPGRGRGGRIRLHHIANVESPHDTNTLNSERRAGVWRSRFGSIRNCSRNI